MSKIATRDAYGKALAALALENKNVVAVDADLSGSTKTAELKKVAPERHFNVGIAESNLVGISAGLACNGILIVQLSLFSLVEELMTRLNTVAYGKLNVKSVNPLV